VCEFDLEPDDSGYGWVMFLVFIAAVLAVTFAVCVLAVIGSWWMLGVAVAIHVSLTAVVMRVVYGAFGTSVDKDEDSAQAPSQTVPSRRSAGVKPARGTLVAHH
jgi:membrane protein implicated in regulation of membrane protease activity